jgi:hypothetical protein
MSAARTVSTAPDLRQYALGLGVVLAAIAIVVAVALARPASVKAPAPVAPAAVQFDHGWSSAASNTKALTVAGTKGGAINYTGIPYQAVQRHSYVIRGTTGGAILYTGIPSAPESTPTNGGRGTRFEQ